MHRVWKLVALCAVALIVSGSIGLAAGEGKDRPDRDRAAMRKKVMERMKKMRELRPVSMPLVRSEAVQAEMARHMKAVEEIGKSVKELRDKVKAEIEAGTKPQEAIKNNLDAAKALAQKAIAEYTTNLENMAKIAKEQGEANLDQIAKRLLRPDRRPPRGRRQPGERKKADKKPRKTDENPFND